MTNKRNKTPTTIPQNIVEMLDSDEELPTEYSEIADTPAYLNDNRFGSQLDEEEILSTDKNYGKYYMQKEDNESLSLSSLTEESVFEKTKNLRPGERALIFKGVLSERDLYCLKSIQPFVDDETVLWFLQYMLKKEAQSNCKFLKSCLVTDFIENPIKLSNSIRYFEPRKYRFDIVCKDM